MNIVFPGELKSLLLNFKKHPLLKQRMAAYEIAAK